MSNLLLKALSLLAPGTLPVPAEDDRFGGTQYRYGRFVVRPEWYRWELLMLAAIALYVAFSLAGRSTNARIGRNWMAGILPTLSSQFSMLSPSSSEPPRADGPATFLSYASGRASVISLHSTVSLFPRHDPILSLYHLLRPMLDVSAGGRVDEMTFDLLLRPVEDGCDVKFERMSGKVIVKRADSDGEGAANGVGLASGAFAVVKKGCFKKTDRWDLLSFPTIQPDKAASKFVDASKLAVFSEHAEITQAIFAPLSSGGPGLRELLSAQDSLASFKSLSISDLPFTKPLKTLPGPPPLTLSLTFSLPPDASPSELAPAYLSVLLNLADLLSTGPNTSPASSVTSGKANNLNSFASIRPETLRRLRQAREAAWREIGSAAVSTVDTKPDNIVGKTGGDIEESAEERRKRERKEGKVVERSSAKDIKKKDEEARQRRTMAALREAHAARQH